MPWKIKQYFVFDYKYWLVLFIGYSSFLTLSPILWAECIHPSPQKNSYGEALIPSTSECDYIWR